MLYACDRKDQFVLKGDFSHLQQADFYIYSTDGGLDRIDTVHVVDGRFKWTIPLEREATFNVVFPNLSEQVVFAYPGDVITLEGDAQQLRSTQVTGNDDNEALTDFRLKHLNDLPEESDAAMQAFISEHPDSRVSSYFRLVLTKQRAAISRLRKGQKLPAFALPPDDVSEGQDTLKPDTMRPMLLVFWASWKRDTYDDFFRLRRYLQKAEALPKHQQLQAVSVSLDTDYHQYHNICKYDSVTWPSRCYFLAWNTPIVQQYGVRDLPFFVLTDHHQTILALGTSWEHDIEGPINQLMTPPK